MSCLVHTLFRSAGTQRIPESLSSRVYTCVCGRHACLRPATSSKRRRRRLLRLLPPAPRRARDPQGHYEALGLGGLADQATLADIKAAFRGKAKRLHPDAAGLAGAPRGGHPPSAESFRRAVAAYHLLRDPQERQRYDSL